VASISMVERMGPRRHWKVVGHSREALYDSAKLTGDEKSLSY